MKFLKQLVFRMSLAAAVVSRGQQQSSQVVSSFQAQSTASVEIVHQRQINKAQLQIPLVPSYGKLITEDFFMRFSIQLPQSVSEEDAEFMSLVSTDVTADQTDRRLVVRLGGIHYVIRQFSDFKVTIYSLLDQFSIAQILTYCNPINVTDDAQPALLSESRRQVQNNETTIGIFSNGISA